MTERSERRRVVITGMGAVSPLGLSVAQLWDGLKAGKSGIGPLTLCDTTDYPCKVGGEVRDFDPARYMDVKDVKRMARFSHLAVAATAGAVADARLVMANEDGDRVGVLFGCGSGGLPETEQQVRVLVAKGGLRISPFYIPSMLVNMAAANVSRIHGVTGYTNTCITACAAGTQAIGEATEVIRRGAADVMITGGTEAGICQLGMGGFSTIGALTKRNEAPDKASRPFDRDRDGFAPSEGAAALVIEGLDHARARGATVHAEIVGWGVTSDAFHLVQPHSEGLGAAKCMTMALKDAGLTTADVDYINAHGTSTPINDAIETMAIKKVFGERARSVPVSSTKSMLGHSLGASGAIEAVACVKSIQDGIVHPTANYETPDPACDLDYVPNKARKLDVEVVLSNSFGFGGQNACLVLRRFME